MGAAPCITTSGPDQVITCCPEGAGICYPKFENYDEKDYFFLKNSLTGTPVRSKFSRSLFSR